MSVHLQCAPSRNAWSCNTNRHSSFNKCPPLPCVQSKPLTHSLASGIYHWLLVHCPHLSGFWELQLLTLCLLCGTAIPLLESLLHTCLVSGNHCCAVYTCSCPVRVHLACLTSWPLQPFGKNVSHSLALVL